MQFICIQLKLYIKIQGDIEYTDLGRGKRRGRFVLFFLEKLSMLNLCICSKIIENMFLIRQFKQLCGVIFLQFFRWVDVFIQLNLIIWAGGGLIKIKGDIKKINKSVNFFLIFVVISRMLGNFFFFFDMNIYIIINTMCCINLEVINQLIFLYIFIVGLYFFIKLKKR